ncbi:patatin-like phospholipase family protein [Leptospira sp. 2 VSF19]|uniref:Patatin-like phospholipase family protein n=1 Tax=Leptospira soteropolitanensis TaxID=2950025 RepID=A0AAW5VA60_9LEPT|nr:patatin-like phospholipase family protein [Leptospira soteropolitanensis]MCW7492392.1 patatin-like phospholipase family protein [Leptospira soteropolitanensis]MCW7499972.1 patatin-like phospholipase family protein [Leptospira soteropolitanensis]MCW7522224.1 patatin-like phospholipase family protein [Leptospira soteropolitanensis]MCW7526079.1 patatin-like phospholipase family protein [Leptospira soteropolitanensis]MCW7529809.1 patatin-like phospholipase family protein [Leptospira soteropolit
MKRIRLSKNPSLSQYLTLADLFKNLPHTVLREMKDHTVREFLVGGEVLFEENSDGNDLYILAAGKLRFEKRGNDGSIRDVGEFKRLDIIGELSLFTGEKRSATVKAIRDSELIRVPRDVALSILLKYPESLLQITKIIAERLAHAKKETKGFVPLSRTYSILSILPKSILDEIIHNLGLVFLRYGSFCVVDEKVFLDRTNELQALAENDREPWIIRFFSQIEAEFDFVFYLIEDKNEISTWSERALRQSDSILFIKEATADPNCIELESLLDKKQMKDRNQILILLQPNPEEVVPGTIKHLRKKNFHRHYHVHFDRLDTWERLGRGLLGKSIGLALGGGGAKGFSHLGVLRALEENQIPIDMVSGTSAGAIFSALIAMGETSGGSEEKAKAFWISKDLLNEYTIPVLSLTTGKKYTEAIRKFFGSIQIEDLWIPYFAIATDLSHSEIRVFDKGDLWKAIRASTSIPGVVPPFVEEGVVYVDGGVLDNVPGIELKERGAGNIISVDVFGDIYPDQDRELSSYFDKTNPGVMANPLTQMTNLINFNEILRPKFPPIGDIIIRSVLASSRERIRQTEKISDLFLQIPTNNFGLLDWPAYKRLIELGYISSKDKINHNKEKFLNPTLQ